MRGLHFELPSRLEAGEPPEARGLARDQVRLMTTYGRSGAVVHDRFTGLVDRLEPGDVLVINTSGTIKAALPARRPGGEVLELHLSTRLPADLWAVELRVPDGVSSRPSRVGYPGETLELPSGGRLTLHAPYHPDERACMAAGRCEARLWVATFQLPEPLGPYLDRYGAPIRYAYARGAWPLEYYQTVYATEPGSAELASAGRAFTPELLTRLMAKGVGVAPLVLHTGVSSGEDHEPPYEEYYRVPEATARQVNAGRGRVIAVGTTAVRALETVADSDGLVHPGEGWTRLVITPERGVRAVDGLLTGLHEPRASHLMMLEAIAGLPHLERAYWEALQHGYLWHEFGDLHLIVP